MYTLYTLIYNRQINKQRFLVFINERERRRVNNLPEKYLNLSAFELNTGSDIVIKEEMNIHTFKSYIFNIVYKSDMSTHQKPLQFQHDHLSNFKFTTGRAPTLHKKSASRGSDGLMLQMTFQSCR